MIILNLYRHKIYICLSKFLNINYMKKILFILASLSLSYVSFAQKKNEKAKYMYKEVTVETDDYKVYIVDAVSNFKQAKFKIKVFNKTNDFLYVKPEEFKYLADGKTLLGTDKPFAIAPNDEVSAVLDFKGGDMLMETYSIELKGIYKASAGSKAYEVPNFNLPASKNDFTINNITCVLLKSDLKTDKSTVRFDCNYTGDGVGIINVTKVSAIMPNGQQNANQKKYKPAVIERGKHEDFFLTFFQLPDAGDMQKKPWSIQWNDTFRESKLVPIGSAKVEMVKEFVKE